MIDSVAATWSTGGLGQLKALQRVLFMELDKTTAESTNFVFGISNTSSIDTGNLNTPFGIIVFYIV